MNKYNNKRLEIKWDVCELHGVFWMSGEAAKSLCGSMKDVLGINFSNHLAYVRDHNFGWYVLKSEDKKVGDFLVNRFKNSNFSIKFIKDYEKFLKYSIKELNKIDEVVFSELSDKEIFNYLKKSTEIYIRNFDFGFIIEPMDFVMPKLIQLKLKKQGYNTSEMADSIALADVSFLNRETQELINIVKNKRQNRARLLKEHAYKYRWLRSAHMGRCDIPFSYFEKRLKKFENSNVDFELEKLRDFKKNTEALKLGLFKNKPIDNETRELIKIVNIIAPVHDMRKEMFLRSMYTIDTIRAEIASRQNCKKQDLEAFLIEDFLEFSKGKKIDKVYAREASKEKLLYVKNYKWRYFYGEEARDIARREFFTEIKKMRQINGTAASIGKVHGIVRIIKGMKDLGKAKSNDVIVSSMTRPEFIVALKKAKAIITDEGGVTCHAAIVSRELGIPCIIGTKIATKVLKDGDLVEVDANQGVVKIIKNTK